MKRILGAIGVVAALAMAAPIEAQAAHSRYRSPSMGYHHRMMHHHHRMMYHHRHMMRHHHSMRHHRMRPMY